MQIPPQPSTPRDTVLLTQISDGADFLKLVPEDLFEFTLKLNILFFDRIAIGAAHLLGSRRFHRFFKEDPASFEKLFSVGERGSAIICPAVWNHNNGLEEIAELMSSAQTLRSLQGEAELRNHARFIDAAHPGLLHMPEEVYRRRFHKLTRELILRAGAEENSLSPIFLGRKKCAKEAVKWLNDRGDPSAFTCSSFYRFIDSKQFGTDGDTLKLIADTVAHYSMSSVLDSRISVVQQVSSIISLLRKAQPLSVEEDDIQEDRFETSFPVGVISRMSFKDILAFREIEAMRAARSLLSDFRASGTGDWTKLRSLLDDCSSKMVDYAFSTPSDRRRFLNAQSSKAAFLKVRMVFNLATYTAPVALTFFMDGGPKNLALLTIVQATMYGLRSSVDSLGEKIGGRNMAHPAVFDGPEIAFEPIEGRVEEAKL